MFVIIPFLLVLSLAHLEVSADSTSIGKCPHIDPKPDFEMEKFVGEWYAIQRTSTDVPCLMYNITEKAGHPGHYLLTETYPSSKLANWVGLRHGHKITGELCPEDKKVPALMDLHVPYEIGSSKLTVFMTDYDNFAAIFACKTYPLTFSRLRKWSAQILSRTPTLDIEYIEKIRTRLSAYNVDPFSLSVINQKHCENADKKGVVLQVASDVVSGVESSVNKLAKDVINLKPKIEEKIDSIKSTIDEAVNKVEEKIQTSKSDSKISEEKHIIQNSFDKPDIFELFDIDLGNSTDEKKPESPKSPYWNPSEFQPTQIP